MKITVAWFELERDKRGMAVAVVDFIKDYPTEDEAIARAKEGWKLGYLVRLTYREDL